MEIMSSRRPVVVQFKLSHYPLLDTTRCEDYIRSA